MIVGHGTRSTKDALDALIGKSVLIDAGGRTERTGKLIGVGDIWGGGTFGFVKQPMGIVRLDTGFFSDDEQKCFTSTVVVHPDNLTAAKDA